MAVSKIERVLRLIERRPEDAYLYEVLGKLYRKIGRLKDMEDAWETSLRLDPCNPWIHLFLGNMFFSRDEWSYAIERFEYAAMLMPDHPCPIWCMAQLHEAREEFELADESFRNAVTVDPGDAQAQRLLSEWEARRRRIQEGGSEKPP